MLLTELAAQPRLNPIEPRAVPLYVLLFVVWSLVIAGFLLTRFTYDGSWNTDFSLIAIILVLAMALRWLSLPRIAGTFEAVVLKVGLSCAAAPATAMLASANLPLVDATLLGWDRALGLDWMTAMNCLAPHRWLADVLLFAYRTLSEQVFILLPALFITRHDDRAWAYVLAWGLALAASAILFPFFPAVGPIVYTGYHLPGIPFQSQHMDVFNGARDGSLVVLGSSTVRGMITFPSFHVAGAIVLAWAAWPMRWLRWPFLILNLLMIVSAVPIGGHYFVDVIGGAMVAVAAILAAERIVARVRVRSATTLS